MGKMKELFMKTNYPNDYDLEREYLINDSIVQSLQYEEYLELQKEINNPTTKIQVANGEKQTRIEVNKEELKNSECTEIT